jgi:hemolysin activation/secretion protein
VSHWPTAQAVGHFVDGVRKVMRNRTIELLASLWVIGCGHAFAADETTGKTFDVWEYRVNGNSVLDTRVIESTLYPYLGPQLDLGRVEAARAALEAVYRDHGYATVSVTIPEQTVDKGFVKLDVVEQRVGRFNVTGAKYVSQRAVAAATPSLAPGSILNTQQVQNDLNGLARRSPDVSFDPRIKAGREVGTLDVDLAVKDRLPLHASVELNNFASANTEDLRLSGTVSYNNLFQRQNSLILSGQVSPQDTNQVKVYSATYVVRPESSGNIYSLTGVHTDSDVAAVGGTTVLGKGDFVFARGFFPLPETRSLSGNLVLGFDYKSSEDQTTFNVASGGGTRTDVSDKRISYVNLVAGYNALLNHFGGTTSFDLTANAGSRELYNGASEFEAKRYKGQPNYIHLDVNASRTQALPWWGMHVVARIRGQWSPDALIANEQFSEGGYTTVRGYLESEELGDYGLGTSVELVSPSLVSGMPFLSLGETFAFWDWGNGRLNNPLPDETAHFTLSSLGLGMRLAAPWGLNAEASWAKVFHAAAETGDGDQRVSFKVDYAF